jgi:hypothetical protein
VAMLTKLCRWRTSPSPSPSTTTSPSTSTSTVDVGPTVLLLCPLRVEETSCILARA